MVVWTVVFAGGAGTEALDEGTGTGLLCPVPGVEDGTATELELEPEPEPEQESAIREMSLHWVTLSLSVVYRFIPPF
jgi:hypothetical protein